MRESIALNRFGLGAKPGDRPSADPQGWLLAQITSYEPRSQAIATAIPASEMFENYEGIRMARRERNRRRAQEENSSDGGSTAMDDAEMAGPARDDGEMGGRPMRERNGRPERRGGRARRSEMGADDRDLARLPVRILHSAVEARFDSAVATETPFAERLVHFWSNHFAVSGKNKAMAGMVGAFEFDAIRPNIMGGFADLVAAVESHPAMLYYLDQYLSVGPNSSGAAGLSARRPDQVAGLNENLAREILELHTMGVRSGYSEADLRELARAMTGRTIAGFGPARRTEEPVGRSFFLASIHEPGARTMLGRNFADTGEDQAAAMIAYAAGRPETARHIATKLARHFIADDPPAAAVARLERAFAQSDGDLPTVYRALVESPEAWNQSFAKFKTPWDWLVSAWRATTPEINATRARGILLTLGQPVWNSESPAGFSDLSSDWLAPDALMRRVEVSQELVRRMPDPPPPVELGENVLPGVLGDESRTAISRADSPAQGLAMLLVTPEFLRR